MTEHVTADDSGNTALATTADLPNLKTRALRRADKNDGRMVHTFRKVLKDHLESEYNVHVRLGSEHYSWDCPGASKKNDLPNGGRDIAKDVSEHAYVTVRPTGRNELTPELKTHLLALANRFDLVARDCGYQVALYPTWETVDN